MLHGWPDDASTWDDVTIRLAEERWRLIVPILRAFGESRFVEGVVGYAIAAGWTRGDIQSTVLALATERWHPTAITVKVPPGRKNAARVDAGFPKAAVAALSGSRCTIRRRHHRWTDGEMREPICAIGPAALQARSGHRKSRYCIVSVAVIMAVGANIGAQREVLGMEIGTSEAEPIWTEFLRKLTRRDLSGVKLVVSDALEGIKAAVSKVLSATWQRYRVHSCAMRSPMPERAGDGSSPPSLPQPLPRNA